MEIVLIAFIFIALLLLIVWVPFFKKAKENNQSKQGLRDETNVVLYKEHKTEIEKDYSDGAIDEESYQYLLAELDNSLLQDVTTTEKEKNKVKNTNHFSVLWPIFLSLFVVSFSVAIYLKQGTLDTIIATPMASTTNQEGLQSSEAQQEEMLAYIKGLQQKIDTNSDDSKAWYDLGQAFVGVGEFDLAIHAFEEVIRIEGEHADLFGAIAQATYYRNNQQIDGQVQTLIDKALALDNNDPSTNILLGMHNFISQEYAKAIEYWQRIIDDNRQSVNIEALKEAVNEAKRRLGSEVNQTPSTAAIDGPQLNLSVSLSDDIMAQLANGEDKVVFVYAIPTDGQRMPLAAIKLMASDLPKNVVLNNSTAMSPQSNLSSVSTVNIYAIVSKDGGAGIKPGDFKAEVQNIPVDKTETIDIVIDSLVE
ncbi:c-type cytochrome biogenesis protein CcmI [Colwellia sp. 1_MG-2023]|uniref:c-type cytochrome biogenesis protein CcmI n=1 Tax=unclassified Colwellia TaxID=196834 RepID=UPI001C09223E|nr:MULTISPECIES: c-type cytochrome biogenesis protein CcmI [unclassified Colwellia]MBU2923301.1 c-type cytochrome biogenesis protein CcmI [Colwellia sp. C2M11]MDO6653712.1 c-type cytochrome biogenesis protein CcmI [Colwellia sp. 3_MG-2023]MDO6666523.1 c-type cytochrome biogenesis protein CcmI [Colwellia sp. 2_MG-2023]MDO6690842.1 c-type cytochrome biogenesis protein CcmI [Colwellia sp. 1_MG-2023]